MLKTLFEELNDSRRGQGQRYDLPGFMMVSILGILSGANSYRTLHTFIKNKLEILKENIGIKWKKAPSYSIIRYILRGIDKESLEEVFRKYSQEISKIEPGKTTFLGIDGKVLRKSFDNFEDQKAIQLLSAFASNEQIIFAHKEVEGDKENEIPVVQNLIKELDITGMILTLDALHCQKKL